MDRHPRFGIAGWISVTFASVALCVGPLFARADQAADLPVRAAAAAPILEPSMLLMLGIGLVGVAIFRARNRNPDADVK